MRLGLFLATFAAILVVLGLAAPVPHRFATAPGGRPEALVPTTRCWALSYAPESAGRYLPTAIRLRPPTAGREPFGHGGQAYRADAPAEGIPPFMWRVAGPDSLDIGWHHSPTLRLPARPGLDGVRVGRAGYEGAWSLYQDLFRQTDFVVHAREMDCAAYDSLPRWWSRRQPR